MSKIELSYATLTLEYPIVLCEYKEDVELGFPEIKELVSTAEMLTQKRPYFTIADVRKGVKITKAGEKFAADKASMPFFCGTAVIVNNTMMKFAGNFMNQLVKKNYPYKIFTSETKAKEWLQTLPLNADK